MTMSRSYPWVILLASCLLLMSSAAALGATPAPTGTPVLVELQGNGTAGVTGTVLDTAGCLQDFTVNDSFLLAWTARIRTRMASDGRLTPEPGYVSSTLGTQSTNILVSPGSPDCQEGYGALVAAASPCAIDLVPAFGGTARLDADETGSHLRGPELFGTDRLGTCTQATGAIAGSDLMSLNSSMSGLLTADFLVDPTKVHAGSQTIPVHLRSGLPANGGMCAAGLGTEFASCTVAASWSGTVTVTPREDDGSDGSTQRVPAPGSVGPAMTGFTMPTGSALGIQRALVRGLSVGVFVSRTSSISARATFAARQRSGRAAALVLFSGVTRASHAGRAGIRLRPTAAGRRILAAWPQRRLVLTLELTATGTNGKRRTVTRPLVLRR